MNVRRTLFNDAEGLEKFRRQSKKTPFESVANRAAEAINLDQFA